MLRFTYNLVINKAYVSMNNGAVSKKSVLLTITMLSAALMLVASLIPSLFPAQAFAMEEKEGYIEDPRRQLNADSNNQEDLRENEGGDNSVIVDPIVQTSVQPAINVDANVHVITDKEDCKEASDNVNQINNLSSNQDASSDGNVGDNSLYISPQVQTTNQLAVNLYVDADLIFAEDCIPSDNVNQINNLSSNQDASSDVKLGQGSTINNPTYQRADAVALNGNVNTDAIIPLSLSP
jgi:hypothetical protein